MRLFRSRPSDFGVHAIAMPSHTQVQCLDSKGGARDPILWAQCPWPVTSEDSREMARMRSVCETDLLVVSRE